MLYNLFNNYIQTLCLTSTGPLTFLINFYACVGILDIKRHNIVYQCKYQLANLVPQKL